MRPSARRPRRRAGAGRRAARFATTRWTPPHGTLDLHRALVVSCNAYFANLAQRLGSKALAEAAAAAQIAAAPPPANNLRRTLPFAGYGQGEVVASPLRMARAAARWPRTASCETFASRATRRARAAVRWIDADGAAQLRRDMRAGRHLRHRSCPGRAPCCDRRQDGTAEVDDARSHSWFVGFAPYSDTPARIAFAVIVENAGYGGRVAAPLAGEIVSAAEARGLLK